MHLCDRKPVDHRAQETLCHVRCCESQSYLALNLPRLVADQKCFPCCVNDLRGECFKVVERLDPAHLCEESIDETEVSSSNSHDGCDGGCVGEVFLGIV